MSKDDSRRRFKWLLAVCAIGLLPLLITLGGWQLQRADEKQQLLAAWHGDALVLESLEQLDQFDEAPLLRVQLDGHFLPGRLLLLDNRTRQGRAGYEAIALVRLADSDKLLPVNLGWIPAGGDRSRLPDLGVPSGEHDLEGRLRPVRPVLILAEDRWSQDWPIRIQSLDLTRLQQVAGSPVVPWILQLDRSPIAGLDTDWPLAALKPEKHLGYAVQWFAMATVLLVLLIWNWQRLRSRGVGEW